MIPSYERRHTYLMEDFGELLELRYGGDELSKWISLNLLGFSNGVSSIDYLG